MSRLIAAGANVNERGKDNMTPLLWAYPDDKPDRFKALLEAGADPNVLVESDFNTRQSIHPGMAVTHMAAKTNFKEYFDLVFDHGGDPNLVDRGITGLGNDTPLFLAIRAAGAGDRRERVQKLIDKGVDLNHKNGSGFTPPMEAVAFLSQYDIALLLLQNGADPEINMSHGNARLIHIVVSHETRETGIPPASRGDWQRLVAWLEVHGENANEAKEDIKRWASWQDLPPDESRRITRAGTRGPEGPKGAGVETC